jgi:hypothetical protein
LIATAVVRETFVYVPTDDAVTGETVTALAFESARSVGAFRIAITVESSEEALVIVRAAWIVLVSFDRVSVLTAALERAERVVTFAIFAHGTRRRALVNIFASDSVT